MKFENRLQLLRKLNLTFDAAGATSDLSNAEDGLWFAFDDENVFGGNELRMFEE